MGFRNRDKLHLFSIVLLLVPVSLSSQDLQSSQLKSLLEKQGFTGALTGDLTIKRLGSIQCGKENLQAIYYEWTETHSQGVAIHQSKRVLFMSQHRYIGSYSIEDAPAKLSQTAVLFNYAPNRGSAITCTSGGLPKTVVLDGEEDELAK